MTVAKAIRIERPIRAWHLQEPAVKSDAGPVVDRLGRPLRELRISVTDRCNFRCVYCMPRSVYPRNFTFMKKEQLLDFDEITCAAEAFVALGVNKLRLTGGEPLLRPQLERLVERLAALRTPEGDVIDLAMTTNGSLLARKAVALRDAGLGRLTVSLDAVSDEVFRRMSDADYPVAKVLAGIDAALRVGFAPIKVNMVVKRGVNDGEIVPLARHVREHYGPAVALRFIEYMDVGESNHWKLDEVLPSIDVIALLQRHFSLERVVGARSGTAELWRHVDGCGEVGTISSVTAPFCGDCSRARLSSDGLLYTCLFSSQGANLRACLADEGSRDSSGKAALLQGAIRAAWQRRSDRYSELRASTGALPALRPHAQRVEMHYIGG
ncbi:MAG: GTP 3',8-cyclase MoaA [Proteobacteria bacterium]|nr:GTP 3',8-cyclase MoaA [Pseudomonadota bacterium]